MAGVPKRQQWQAHIDDALLRTGQVQRAAIFGLDGKEWATSSGFQVVAIYSTIICKLGQLQNPKDCSVLCKRSSRL